MSAVLEPSAREMEVRSRASGSDADSCSSSTCSEDSDGECGAPDCDAAAVPPQALARAFGRHGSFRVSGKLPVGNMFQKSWEEPYRIRELHASPSHLKRRHLQALLSQWGVAALNSKGCKGGSSTYLLGQDNLCLARLATGWEVFGVFDGHGPGGHWPSERLARTVPFFLQCRRCAELLLAGDGEAALRAALAAAEEDLEAQAVRSGIDIDGCGSTGVVALRPPGGEELFVANVGDSRAVLFQRAGGAVLRETEDHKPKRKDETERIERCGGTVQMSPHSGAGESRVYHRGCNYPGIAVSRSFGDCSVKSIGVSAEPEIVRWPTKGQGDLCLLLCSDGVWEFLSSQEVATLLALGLAEGDSLADVLWELLDRSRNLWRDCCAGCSYCDDISMILASLGGEAPRWDAVDTHSSVGNAALERMCNLLHPEAACCGAASDSDESAAGCSSGHGRGPRDGCALQ